MHNLFEDEKDLGILVTKLENMTCYHLLSAKDM